MTPRYAQTDKRWANEIVGFGTKTQTFKNVGCTVTALTYLYNEVTGKNLTPPEVNERLKNIAPDKNGRRGFIGASIYWVNIYKALPELQWVYRDWNYNNAIVAAWIYIYPKVPVLAEVVEPKSVTGRHWLLLIGGRKFFNPLTGNIQPTSDYKVWTGSSRFKKGT